MTILVYKDGRWLIDNEQPLEGVSLDNLAAILSNPKDGDVVKYDEESGMWIVGEAGTYSKPSGGIPETDLAQAVKDKLNKFVVTLTPTALDYSGTMDKTVAEINAAYEAGQEIVFRVMMSATEYMDVDCTERYKDEDYAYPSFNAYIVDNINNVIIFAFTAAGNDDTQQTYGTTVYSLTPAS